MPSELYIYPMPSELQNLLDEADRRKAKLDAARPLPPDVEGRAMQKLRLDWNWSSNAIEGNSLTYGETAALLMHGVTAKGKPLKDHLDITGHNQAVNILLEMLREARPLTEADIRSLHAIMLGERYENEAITPDGEPVKRWIEAGAYKAMPNHVRTKSGEIHYYAEPQEVPYLMGELVAWLNEQLLLIEESDADALHPIIVAAELHYRFVAIHPFDDGNGRMSRWLMNLVLLKLGYTIASIPLSDREYYYSVLAQADAEEYSPFYGLIASQVIVSLSICERALRGENINESTDFRKRILLLKKREETTPYPEDQCLTKSNALVKICVNELAHPIVNLVKTFWTDISVFFIQIKYKYNNHDIEYMNYIYFSYITLFEILNTLSLLGKIDHFNIIVRAAGMKKSKQDVDIFSTITFLIMNDGVNVSHVLNEETVFEQLIPYRAKYSEAFVASIAEALFAPILAYIEGQLPA